MKEISLNFVDLFSGCGGLSTGLELAGHKCLLGVDFNKDAIASFKKNHKHAETFLGDIKKLSEEEISKLIKNKKIDVVVGGPPCQGFSTVGKGDTNDDRNQLFREFVRIVNFLKPEIVIFENVLGILAEKNEPVLKQIFAAFEEIGYHMSAQVLSAEQYGVPEVRKRTILIGCKSEKADHPAPSHGKGLAPVKTVEDFWKNLKAEDGQIYNNDLKPTEIKKTLDKQRLSHIPEGKGIRYQKDEIEYLPKKLYFDVNWSELRENRFRQTKLQRLDRKKPSPTILTSCSTYYHPTEDRYLTIREAAACQSFPNDFIFEGSYSAQFKQIGNAVPPLLGKALGEHIKKYFKKEAREVAKKTK